MERKKYHLEVLHVLTNFIFFKGNFVNAIETAFAAGVGWLITFCSKGEGNLCCST
jgi:hypothetical protein